MTKKDQILNGELVPLDYWRFYKSIDVDPATQCWNWTKNLDIDGYALFSVKRTTLKGSRFAYKLHNGKIPKGGHVCHTCDNRRCCNPDHLYVGTPGENAIDRTKRGRHPNHVSDETIIAIQKLDTCWSYKAIASTYGISRETAKRIVTRSRPRYREIYKSQEAGVQK